jgi:uncharacterized membrane-anchored protein
MPPDSRTTRRQRLQPLAAKVPAITLMFWVLKLITTGMGEAMSDFLGDHSVPLAAAVGFFGIAIAYRLQTSRREYSAPYYWFMVMMVAIFGTMVADGLHDGTGMPYPATTSLFAIVVAAIFFFWYRSERTLSIHTINTRRREAYYWAAVLGTFALGTAAGDMTATSLNLGYFDSVLLFSGVIAIPAIGYWTGKFNPIFTFWFAYIVTRPIGASFADWFSKPAQITGLGLGDGTVSGLALIVFVGLVAYLTITKRDVQPSTAHRAHAHLPRPHVLHPHVDRTAAEPQPAEN